MLKRLISIMAAFLLLATTVAAKPLSMAEIQEGTCRVQAGSAFGSGTCYMEDAQNYHVLTNAHVVGKNTNVTVEFFKSGYKTRPIAAVVLGKWHEERTDVDFAILAVPKTSFGSFPPRVIPLTPREYKAQPGNYIYSAGCPSALWAQSWQGHLQLDEGSRYIFMPAPIGGQSGSGIFVILKNPNNGQYYTRLAGVVTWRISQGSQAVGGAIPINTLYGVWKGNYRARIIPASYKTVAHFTYEGNPDKPCRSCGRTLHYHAHGSDDKFYCINHYSDGSKGVSNLPHGVTICDWGPHTFSEPKQNPIRRKRSWGEDAVPLRPLVPVERERKPTPLGEIKEEHVPYYGKSTPLVGPYPFGDQGRDMTPCPPGGDCPPPGNSGPFGWFGGNQNPQPQPGPYDGSNSPYGVVPPNVPWDDAPAPGPTPGPIYPPAEPQPPSPTPAPIEPPPAVPQPQVPTNPVDPEVGNFPWFSTNWFRHKLDMSFPQALGVAGLTGLLLMLYRRLKPRILSALDQWEDKLQRRIADRFGDGVAQEMRDIIEGAEGLLFGIADKIANEKQVVEGAVKAKYHSQVMDQLGKVVGNGGRKATADDVEAVVDSIAKDIDDDTMTPEAAEKIKSAVRDLEANKKKGV